MPSAERNQIKAVPDAVDVVLLEFEPGGGPLVWWETMYETRKNPVL